MDAIKQSKNTERLIRMLDSLGAEPSTPRKRELIWGLIACFLLVAYLDSGSLAGQIVADRKEQIRYLPALTNPLANCERNTRVAVAALNAWEITEGEVKVACKRVKS